MNIYVVRHGETDWNKKNLLQGTTDIELNDNGIESAKILAEKLKDINFDVIYSSPLKRAITTAQYICEKDFSKIQQTEKIIERGFGDCEGKTLTKKQMGDFWNYELNLDNYNVESIERFFDRIYNFLEEIYIKYGDTDYNILLVTHNGVGIAVDSIINGFPNNFFDLNLKNCEYKVFKKVHIDEENYKKRVKK